MIKYIGETSPQNGPNQMFYLTSDGHLRSLGTKHCADATEVKEGGPMRMRKCVRQTMAQRWTYITIPSGGGLLRNMENKLCLTLSPSKSLNNSAHVILRPCVEKPGYCEQVWIITYMDQDAPVLPVSESFDTSVKGEVLPIGKKLVSKKAGRILCWILTMPASHAVRAVAINNTWGHDCDILLFASTELFSGLPVVALELGAAESRNILWSKSRQMWMYVYTKYIKEADWFVKADDDTCKKADSLYLKRI